MSSKRFALRKSLSNLTYPKKIKLMFMNIRIATLPFFAILCMLFVSCSDDSSDVNDMNSNLETGSIMITGDIEAQHEGLSQYIGLRSNDGGFINLTLNVTEHPLGSAEVNDFSLSIRMVGEEGPFALEVGEYEIGHNSEDDTPLIIVNYANRVISDETITYGTSPNSTGTVTILSVSSTNIEATFDVNLDVDVTADEGTVNVTGELNAKCSSASTGTGC